MVTTSSPTKTLRVTKKDIKEGISNSSSLCPVARALKRCLKVKHVAIGGSYLSWERNGVWWNHKAPKSIRDFIGHFDTGQYVEPFEFVLKKENVHAKY